ncbi:MAG: heavy metal transporter [Ruminiclostridium sp.]|nr:heavy metal transporter [Ruminiclostridium sp.]
MTNKFILQGLECSNCAAKMERAIKKLDGVTQATVNFLTQKLVIEADENKMSEIIRQAEKTIQSIESQVKLKKA